MALVAVLWIVGFLSMTLTVTLLLVRIDAEISTAETQGFRAWQLAHEGFSYAAHPSVNFNDPLLTYKPKDIDESYRVELESEAAKLNLNYVIRSGDKRLLHALFKYWLEDDDQAAELADAMFDWVDKDDLVSLNGAEKEWYSDRGLNNMPFNRSFQSLDEVRLVKGFQAVERKIPHWRDWFTLRSEGPIDIHEASPELLYIAAETELSTAEDFHRECIGDDAVRGTNDDHRYSQLDAALNALASRISNRDTVIKRFILKGNTLRIVSRGRSGIYRTQIRAVVRKRGQNPNILFYQEEELESE